MEQAEQIDPRAVSAETLVGCKQAKLPVKLPAVIADQVIVRPSDPVLLPELFLSVTVEKHPEPRKIPREKVAEPLPPDTCTVASAEEEADDLSVRDGNLAEIGFREIFVKIIVKKLPCADGIRIIAEIPRFVNHVPERGEVASFEVSTGNDHKILCFHPGGQF